MTNLFSKYVENDGSTPQPSTSDENYDGEKSYNFKPALGNCWHSVPTHRILITPVDPNPINNVDREIGELQRKLALTKSSCIASGKKTVRDVRICDRGVVDDAD